MRIVTLILILAGLAACATSGSSNEREIAEKSKNQAVIDFVEVRELTEVDRMRASDRDSWDELTMTYIVFKSRRTRHLVEFARPCYEMRDNTQVTPDNRSDPNHIRAKFDTIRGCRINRMWELTRDEAAELGNLGDAVGSRN